MRLGLVTNNRAVNARRVIERYDLVFDTVWTRDDGAYKPSAEPIRRAAERLGLAPGRLAAVGDNELDLRAARGAGVGLVSTVNPDVERFRAVSDLVAADLDGLTPLLLDALGAGLTLPD